MATNYGAVLNLIRSMGEVSRTALADAANAALARDSYLRRVHGTTVELSGMGTDTAALGAASMVLRVRLTPTGSSR